MNNAWRLLAASDKIRIMVAALRSRCLICPALLTALSTCMGAEILVHSRQELLEKAKAALPGDEILLAEGIYTGVHLVGLKGSPEAPIVIRGTSREAPARFVGGTTGLHLSGARHVTLRFLDVREASGNGINIDDAGAPNHPATGIVVEHCRITDIGPQGNHDALKLSGVDQFVVRDCYFSGWGGSAIDMVGCHDGVVRDCTFAGKEDFSQANAVQMKGGTARVRVLSNVFQQAGQRSINIGGGTGRPFFRPRVEDFEAKDIEVAGNRFKGSLAPIAWVSCSGGQVHHNTIVHPEKWVARILQEGDIAEVLPANGGMFENNLIVFDENVRTFVNIGPNTAPETFIFRRNAWYETNANSTQRKPVLPTPETDGVYGVNPQLSTRDGLDDVISSNDPALRGIGADAFNATTR